MACNITLAGIATDCLGNVGGVKRVWLSEHTESAATVANNEITGFADGVSFKEYQFRKNTASMTQTLNINENGSNYVSTELVMLFNRLDTAKRVEMSALATDDLMAIVEDANGVKHFLGYDEPVVASAGTGETGTAKTDRNGYSITLTDESATFPYIIKSDVVIPVD